MNGNEICLVRTINPGQNMRFFLSIILLSLSLAVTAQNETTDWANLGRYKSANMKLKPPAKGEQRVVFMGNSITENWPNADSFFQKHTNYINRGISGQTTPQMLLRFRQDVIQLNPSAVVILAGINDIAQNTEHYYSGRNFRQHQINGRAGSCKQYQGDPLLRATR